MPIDVVPHESAAQLRRDLHSQLGEAGVASGRAAAQVHEEGDQAVAHDSSLFGKPRVFGIEPVEVRPILLARQIMYDLGWEGMGWEGMEWEGMGMG